MWLNPFFFLIHGEAKNKARNQHGRKSHDKIGGKVLLLHLILNFVCLFARLFFVCFFNRFLLKSSFLFFHLFCDNLSCSGMFRNVPKCSGMFRNVPCSGFC